MDCITVVRTCTHPHLCCVQAIGEFIRDYNPADLIASVDGLTARVQTDFPPALANFSIKLSTMQADVNTVW
jgi:hypothetical protein